jgi:mannitol/fructose-specific phosphotransferase system IIA component (Ntr-type)
MLPGMSSPVPSRLVLTDLISAEAVVLNLHGSQRDDVLCELVGQIPKLDDNARKTLFKALQERETLCSTGIGDGIALPHCRNALVGLVDKPIVVFGRHDQGIPFGAVDGNPARLFFLIVATNVSQHLQILARLSRILKASRIRENLLTAERPGRVIAILQEAEAKI